MKAKDLFSGLVSNRSQLFQLIEAAEQQFGCEIDEKELQAEIDAQYDGRTALTEQEAQDLLMKVSRPRRTVVAALPSAETKSG